ncbi:hypothetical protein DTO96_102198 [Ephemeroptericola cinctiostellae]|uniref:Transporter n=1 Tax=Ephemeroptericola cinctiostellae TaxID=2268024 RepID=A0A345DDK6_9BURK|nr:hypothetical protein [Ephemeroptericola cinctiostellae]AXF86444.1 hypothetical protein DTO96_102198 [Ephemeroptericola cinctiostellae]
MKKKSFGLTFGVVLALVGVFHAPHAWAQGADAADEAVDAQAYCTYIMQKAKAQIITLRSPDLNIRVDNNSTENKKSQTKMVVSLSKDLVDLNKSRYVRRLADNECEVYRLSLQMQNVVQYALAGLDEQALTYKLGLFDQASNQMQPIMDKLKQQVRTQNATVIDLYNAQTLVRKVETMAQQTKRELAAVRRTSQWRKGVSLNDLLKNMWQAEAGRQANLTQLEKQGNWGLEVQAGLKKTLSNTNNTSNNSDSNQVDPYFSVNARYNLGAVVSNRLLDASRDSYMKWKGNQVNGMPKELANMIASAVKLRNAEKERLAQLSGYLGSDGTLVQLMGDLDSPEALNFKTVLKGNQLLNAIEQAYAQRRVDLLTQFLKEAGL